MALESDVPEAIEEINQLAERFGLSAKEVLEKVVNVGMWMPMETLAYDRPLVSRRHSS